MAFAFGTVWRNSPIVRKGRIICMLPLAGVVVAGLLSLYGLNMSNETRGWLLHTMRVRPEIAQAMAETADVWGGHTAFLLDGGKMRDYSSEPMRRRVRGRLIQIARLVKDDPAETERIERARADLDVWFEELRVREAQASSQSTFPAPIPPGELKKSEEKWRRILATLNEMYEFEKVLFIDRYTGQEAERNAAYWIIRAAIVIGLVSGAASGYLLVRGIVKRIAELSNYARERGEGRDSKELEPSGDEIGQLAAAFRHAADMMRKRELEAVALRSRFLAVMQNMTAIMLIKDNAGRILFCNKAYQEYFQLADGQIEGKTEFDLLPPDVARRTEQAEKDVLSTGLPSQREEVFPTTHGDRAFLCVRFPLAHEGGGDPEICLIGADVTDRKAALEALELERQGLELRVQQRTADLAAANALLQEAGRKSQDQLLRLQLLSQITRAISGRHEIGTLFRIVLSHLRDSFAVEVGMILHFDQESGLFAVAGRVDSTAAADAIPSLKLGCISRMGSSGLEEYTSGRTIYRSHLGADNPGVLGEMASAGFGSVTAAPLAVGDLVLGLLLVARKGVDAFSSSDCEFLTQLGEHVALAVVQLRLFEDLRNANESLRETQEQMAQQERLRAMGQLASGIAHDISNALGPVTLHCELMLEEEILTEEGRNSLETILGATEGVTKTIAGLRTFYRSADDSPVASTVSLNDLVSHVIELSKPRWKDMAQRSGAKIDIELEFDPRHPQFRGFDGDVRNALTNLVFNAVDAMPSGGTLTLRTFFREEEAVVEVSDTGVGMDDHTRRRCMEPFYTTKGERGTGLGLAMVYGVMKRHQGRIEIESQLGQGTTVRLVFPLGVQPTYGSPLTNSPSRPSRPMNILCVDDDRALRESLTALLKHDGHLVVQAESGPAALEILAGGKTFDAVITDLGMPGMDGRELVSRIREIQPGLPAILLTGWGSHMANEPSNAKDFVAVLSKPPRSAQVRAALAKVGK